MRYPYNPRSAMAKVIVQGMAGPERCRKAQRLVLCSIGCG